jgi:hypothetical protein
MPVPFSAAGVSTTLAPRNRSNLRRSTLKLSAIRFGFLAVAISLALGAGAHPVGLVIGLSTTIPAVVIGAILQRPPIVETGPAPPPDDASWDEWNPWLARERDPGEAEER